MSASSYGQKVGIDGGVILYKAELFVTWIALHNQLTQTQFVLTM